jgi:hypothetical protein
VDVLGDSWAAQVKQRAGVPDYLIEGMRQIKEATEGTYLTPLLVLRTKPGRGKEAQTFVVIEAEQWRKIYDAQ